MLSGNKSRRLSFLNFFEFFQPIPSDSVTQLKQTSQQKNHDFLKYAAKSNFKTVVRVTAKLP